jgi:hypothetical protein
MLQKLRCKNYQEFATLLREKKFKFTEVRTTAPKSFEEKLVK